MAADSQGEIFVLDNQTFSFMSDEAGNDEQEDEICLVQVATNSSDKQDDNEDDNVDEEPNSRKSRRLKKEKRAYSPTLGNESPSKKKKRVSKANAKNEESPAKITIRSHDTLPDGSRFCCDLCKSPYVCNPGRRGNRYKVSKHKPLPRHKVDAQTGKTMTLCNACGIAFDRPRKVSKAKPPPTAEEKAKYLDESRTFAMSLVEGLNDPDAERLSCPYISSKPCACLQQYVIGDANMEGSRNRASELLALLKEAKQLIAQKSYAVDDVVPTKGKKRVPIGLGNGHKRSKAYEEFVMKKRKYLREEIKLCEQATQKVLLYSNNFLHKRLKTEKRKRWVVSKGKAALGLLTPIIELHKEKCCIDNCVLMSLTHGNLLQQWRDRAKKGQLEARKVLAEMLTPSGGARCNCYKFINWVTGSSHSTISRVSEQMRVTGGDRTPPEHGLKKYWQEVKAKKAQENPPVPIQAVTMSNTPQSDSSNIPLQVQRQQLLTLQRQITQQQMQLQHQQQILQQSLGQVAQSDTLLVHNNVIQQAPPISTITQPDIRQPTTAFVPHIQDYGGPVALAPEHDTDQVWNTQTISIGNMNFTVVIQPTGETTLLSVNPAMNSLENVLLESQATEECSDPSEQTLSNDMVLLLGQHGINVMADKNGT